MKATKQHKNQPKQQETRNKKPQTIFVLGAILLLTIIVYSNSIFNDFTNWDDTVYITKNDLIKDLSFDGIRKMFTSFYGSNYHPLTCLSNAFEYKFFGLNPKVYHLNNLILHLLNVVLVFYFVKILMDNGKLTMENEKKSQQLSIINYQLSIPFFVALFFAIHPMHAESVAWAAERKDVLYSSFFLLSLIFYCSKFKVQSPKLENSNYQLSIINYQLSILFFLCSCFSKSMAVTLPLVLILIDWIKNTPLTPLKEGKFIFKFSNFQIFKLIPFLLISLIFGIIAIKSQSSGVALQELPSVYSFFDKLLLVCYSVSYYIFHLFVPIGLSAFHHYPEKVGGMLPMEYYISPLFILLILFGIFRLTPDPSPKERGIVRKEIIFGLLFFLLTISVVLQVISVGAAIVAERYSYIPYIGLIFIVVKIVASPDLSKGEEFRMAKRFPSLLGRVRVGLLLVVLVFSFMTFQRNKVWKDSVTLWSDVIEKDNKIDFAYFNRGADLSEQRKYKDAIADYNQAIRINPNYDKAFYSRGFAKANLNDVNGAISDYNQAIVLNPKYFEALNNRGSAKGALGDFRGALNDFNEAIIINPKYSEAYSNRGNAKTMLKDNNGAVADYSQAIILNPKYSDAYFNRGVARLNMNKISEACEDWRMALQLGDNSAAGMMKRYCQ